MKYLAVIQARCGSSRLPNKVLMDLGGKAAILRVVERLKLSKYVEDIVVATSIEKNNLPLIKVCAENGVRVFVGSEQDVLDRYYRAAQLFEPAYVIRVTADCPVYDPHILDSAIETMQVDTEYLTDFDSTLADGLDIEIVKFETLKYIHGQATLMSEREHVTLYVKNHRKEFKTLNFQCPFGNLSNLRWTVDEQEDYELISMFYKHFGNQDFFTQDILQYVKNHIELAQMNSKYKRNEGLAKSLKNDYVVRDKK